jgi:hypothetical protein
MKKTAVIILSLLVVGVVIAVYPGTVASNTVAIKDNYLTVADSQSTLQIISMPVEYINYTISTVNGSLWATVDGTYPMQIPTDWVGHELPMVYPTPPGVTNISLELDGQKVDYSNNTQTYPDMLHYTYLGMWQMMLFTIQAASPEFLLTIHYQHPILQANGTYMFLYDLNISPYLSNASGESTAHFNIFFQTNCSDINVYMVPGDSSIPRDNTRTPVNFTISKDNSTQTVVFNLTSDYSLPVPGDELVTFRASQNQVPEFSPWTIPLLLSLMVAAGLLVYFKKRRH